MIKGKYSEQDAMRTTGTRVEENADDRKIESSGTLGSDVMLAEYVLGADFHVSRTGDIDTVSDELSLGQAIVHRLRTIKGELGDLGHPEYGSNLFDFIGEPNNRTTRARLRLAIRDTIRQEPRVKEIISITVKPFLPNSNNSLNVADDHDNTESNNRHYSKDNALRAIDAVSRQLSLEKAGKSVSSSATSSPPSIPETPASYAAMVAALVNSPISLPGVGDRTSISGDNMLNAVYIDIVVLPVDKMKPVQIGFPFNLEAE